MPETPVLDRAVIDDMVEHIGADALRPVIELFVGESRRYVTLIRQGATAGDTAGREAARRAAHSLKSSAGQLGAAALAEAAAGIERVSEDGEASLGERAAALETCAKATAVALTGLLS